jgi:hypothetical protein
VDGIDRADRIGAAATRRAVVGTGVKLAYAAPLVAASFRLGAMGAAAQVSQPGCTCPPGFTPTGVAEPSSPLFRRCCPVGTTPGTAPGEPFFGLCKGCLDVEDPRLVCELAVGGTICARLGTCTCRPADCPECTPSRGCAIPFAPVPAVCP